MKERLTICGLGFGCSVSAVDDSKAEEDAAEDAAVDAAEDAARGAAVDAAVDAAKDVAEDAAEVALNPGAMKDAEAEEIFNRDAGGKNEKDSG